VYWQNSGRKEKVEAYYLLTIAKFYFYNGNYEEAISNFILAKETDSDLSYESCKYLIEIYLRYNVSLEKVEELIETIEDFEYDQLEWSAKDLELKYDL